MTAPGSSDRKVTSLQSQLACCTVSTGVAVTASGALPASSKLWLSLEQAIILQAERERIQFPPIDLARDLDGDLAAFRNLIPGYNAAKVIGRVPAFLYVVTVLEGGRDWLDKPVCHVGGIKPVNVD